MANTLDLSDDGLKTIIGYEDEIDGLYNDTSNYCTFGIGHLAHPSSDKKEQWSCFMLDAALAPAATSTTAGTATATTAVGEAGKEPDLKSLVLEKIYPQNNKLSYLPRGVVTSSSYDALGTKALAQAQTSIAQIKYSKAYDKLSADEKAAVDAKAKAAVDEQKRLLALNVRDTFKADLKPYIKSVNDNVTGVTLTQAEFDALVAFTFNVGKSAFESSTLLNKINENKYRSGETKDRKPAMDAIEAEFLKWNKSNGAVVDGLTTRRQKEADSFLAGAKKEYDDQVKAAAAAKKPK
jgi:GH24 family phage-related lysozyme (muramidase)